VFGQVGGALLGPVRRVAGAWRSARRTVAVVPDVMEAILVLPRVSQRLEVIGFQTATLLDMQEEIARVRGDTASLPPMSLTLERMAVLLDRVDANTAAVEQLAQVVLPLQGAAVRVGRAADRWPGRHRTPPRP
jgi:cob(I)alamin adenosyltransferase